MYVFVMLDAEILPEKNGYFQHTYIIQNANHVL